MRRNKTLEGISKLNLKLRKDKELPKPCYILGFCPYGPLVEDMEFEPIEQSCKVFGHICPVFKCAEIFTEGDWIKASKSKDVKRTIK